MLRTPWSRRCSIKTQKTVYNTACALHTLRQTITEAPAATKKAGQDQEPGQGPGNKERAGTREPEGHPGPRTKDRWQPTGPVGLHATQCDITRRTKATQPCNIAWYGRPFIHSPEDTHPQCTIWGYGQDYAPAMCGTRPLHTG